MNRHSEPKKPRALRNSQSVSQISVCGYKSITHPESIEIRPLTILAGANSSGKSSIVQPILLLKQTLEVSYDPGTLLLDGPNVRFTSGDQFLSRLSKGKCQDTFSIGIDIGTSFKLKVIYKWHPNRGLDIQEMIYWNEQGQNTLRPNMTEGEILSENPHVKDMFKHFASPESDRVEWAVARDRCFLSLEMNWRGGKGKRRGMGGYQPTGLAVDHIRQLIHVPALRGNPARTYPVTAVGPTFPGTFETYVASVIAQWQADERTKILETLNRALESLGLTWKVVADPITHTQVELKVGRLPHGKRGGAYDLVSIADVGFGVSQTLPVIVALLVAKGGQVVYLEQPEIHLHPRAQAQMAGLLSEAARRGVRVIVETHSSILLRAVQTLVARGELRPDLVKLHWFTRREEDGSTEVHSADLDKEGAFGEWPQDFDETAITAEKEYLDAAEARSES